MKNALPFILFISMLSCKKDDSTSGNNNNNNSSVAYEVDGVHDVTLQNNKDTIQMLTLNVIRNNDSTGQETMSMHISGVPDGIIIDSTNGLSGIPSFSTVLTFYDTTMQGAVPGIYPVIISCFGSKSGNKDYTFNLTIVSEPIYTRFFAGKYTSCSVEEFFGGVGGPLPEGQYTDSVYLDPVFNNKIWFTNFYNSGQKIYGIVSLSTLGDTILHTPDQTVNGYSFSETAGNVYAVYNHTKNSIGWGSSAIRVSRNGNTIEYGAYMAK